MNLIYSVFDLHLICVGYIGVEVKTKGCRKDFLVLFCFLAAAFFTPSEYVDCQNLFPDENLDYFGTFRISQIAPCSLGVSNFVQPSVLKYSSGSLLLWVPFPQSINSRVALAPILRC